MKYYFSFYSILINLAMRNKFIIILILLVFASCSRYEFAIEKHSGNTHESESVLSEALRMMSEIYGPFTKAAHSGYTYHELDFTTKSGSGSSIHVVNFDENAGFVAMTGTSAEDAVLLAVSDNGNLDVNQIVSNMSSSLPYFGFTDSLAVTPFNPVEDPEEDDPEDMPYDDTQDIDLEETFSLPINRVDFNHGSIYDSPFYAGVSEGLISDGAKNQYDTICTEIVGNCPPPIWGAWENHSMVATLIRTTWNQSSPYNDLCPVINDTVARAGCVAIAVGQIAAFYRMPAEENWDIIANFDRYDEEGNPVPLDRTSSNITILADYIHRLGEYMDMEYGTQSSSSNIYKARKYLRRKTELNARVNKWDWDRARGRIRKGIPVFVKGHGPQGGHAWIIDGYLVQRKYNQAYPYGYMEHYLVHVNWGWGGAQNGYYATTAFDPTKDPIAIDSNMGEIVNPRNDSAYFDTKIKMLTWGR